ncbi:MAG: DM13 domain-containing protein [Chloroflexi bacterium]|nr:MAG: DM13 domain-containing protein [Chloroflexota bacterium]
MSIFGDLETFLSDDLYPYRFPLAIGFVLLLLAGAFLAYRAGWHRLIWRHRLASAAIGLPLIALAVFALYPLVSPLFERSLACEASPIAGAGAGSEKCENQVAAAPAGTVGSSPGASTATALPTAAPTPQPTFAARVVQQGQFKGADDFHYGSGKALLIETAPGQYTLRFEDFSVRNGPDLYVYLSTELEAYGDGSLQLGTLKATDGAFNYEVPPGTDGSKFKSALVWCKQFSVLFAVAPFAGA